jgi:serine/threonine-protein kinase
MNGRLLAGRYELQEVVGSGGMAVVYRATDQMLGRQVAVKVLREQFAEDDEIVARFEREAKSAARLAHPNVVDIYDVGQDGATHFIVMALIEGENLKGLVRRTGALRPAEVIRLGREIAAALEYAHRRGLVHRDVKPQNVLLDGQGHARLADFGIAQAADAISLTQTGTVLGTAQYMAPEQARGRGTTPVSDIYSLGIVLYELATGKPPFDGGPPLAIALRQVEEAPRLPRELNPNLPPQLEAVILKALAKAPADRFQSAAELAEALAATLQPAREPTARVAVVDRPAPRPSGRTATPPEPTTRRQPPAPPPPAPGRRAPAPRQQRGGGAGPLLLLILLSLIALGFGAYWLLTAGRPAAAPTPAIATPKPASKPTAVSPPAVVAPTREPTRPAPTPVPTSSPVPTLAPVTAPTATSAPPSPTSPPPTRPPAPTQAPARVAVPALVGLSLGDAQTAVAGRDLILEFNAQADPRAPEGVVLAQEPAEGASVAPRSVVRVTVNRPNLVAVPNVQGLEEDPARRALQQAGFKVSVEPVSGGRKGVINDQSPQPGVRVAPGTEVKIFIGS